VGDACATFRRRYVPPQRRRRDACVFRGGLEDSSNRARTCPASMEHDLKTSFDNSSRLRWPFDCTPRTTKHLARARCLRKSERRSVRRTALHFDHAETITRRSIERIRALGGGIAIQHRWRIKGVFRRTVRAAYGHTADAADASVRCAGGRCTTDRVASYKPMGSLYCSHWKDCRWV